MKFANLLGATALASTLLTIAVPASAQDAPAPPLTQSGRSQPQTEDDDDGTVVVTGSRIRRPNYETLDPSIVVNAEYIETRGLTNVANALNELPGFRGSVTPNGDQSGFGVGVNFVNSFGIGSARTLTLIDGRRVVSSNTATIFGPAAPGLQVDLNVVPTALVERIETISIGGAPTYGSDAIAGVTNVILKRDFDGIDLRLTGGVTERGDNGRYNGTVVAGKNFASGRGNITGSLSYDKTLGVPGLGRERTVSQFLTTTNPSAATALLLGGPGRTPANDGRVNATTPFNEGVADGVSGNILIQGRRIFALTRGGVLSSGPLGLRATPTGVFRVGPANSTNFRQFDSNGNLVPFTVGSRFTTTGIDASGGEGLNLAEFTQITSEVERFTATARGTFNVTENIRVFADGLYYRGRAIELLNQPIFNADSFGGASGAIRFTIDNPLLTAQARQTLVAAGYTAGQQITLSRGSGDIVTPRPRSNTDLYRVVGGVDGEFNLAGKSVNFEVTGVWGRSDSRFIDTALNQQRFANAVNVARDASGNVVCSTAGVTLATTASPTTLPVADASCVPLDLFGDRRASAASLAYVTQQTIADSRLEQWVVNANIGTTLFNIWGGGVGLNLGYEHRDERARFTPDAFLQQGLGRSVAISPVAGGFNVDEIFGEILIPLVSPNTGLSFLNRLEVVGKGRYVENTVNGGFFSWTAGGRVSIIPDIEFRGNFTRSFRAPSVTELFSPRTNIFTFVDDLCSPGNIGAGPDGSVNRRANCASFLTRFPTATPLVAASASVPGISGGNPNLDNEVSNSFTYGVVLKPRFIPRLSATVDYISFNIRNPIASLTAAQIVRACFDNSSFNAGDPANGNAFCSLIRRDTAGQVVNDALDPGVLSGFINGNRIKFNGIQAAVDYSIPVGGGSLSLGGSMLYNRYRISDITGVAPLRSDGVVGDPEFQGQLNIAYDLKTVGAVVSVNYTGEQLNTRTATVETTEYLEYPDYVTLNLSAYVRFAKQGRLVLSVTNLTDQLGPFPITQDALGRRFTVGFQARY